MFSGTVSLLPGGSSGGGSGGTISLLPGGSSLPGTISTIGTYTYSAPTQNYVPSYSYQSYNYQTGLSPYSAPGAGMQAGPFGERGPYTPLDFPLIRELLPGEALDRLNPQGGLAQASILPYLALGIIAALLLK